MPKIVGPHAPPARTDAGLSALGGGRWQPRGTAPAYRIRQGG